MIEQIQYQLRSVRLSGMAEHLQVRLQEAKANDLPYDIFRGGPQKLDSGLGVNSGLI